MLNMTARIIRRLTRHPFFTLTTIVTLTVGFSVVAISFAFMDGVLLKSLPYPQSQDLVSVRHLETARGSIGHGNSEASYLFYREQSRSFQELGAYLENVVTLSDQTGDPVQLPVALCTSSAFSALEVNPVLGRLFRAEDGDRTVVLISYRLWQVRYGGDPGIIGRRIELNRTARRVIGIMPAEMTFPNDDVSIWYPLAIDAMPNTENWTLGVIGRLKRGATVRAASAELATLYERLVDFHPESATLRKGQRRVPEVRPLKVALTESVAAPLYFVFSVAGFVLLLVWANCSNLLISRAERRKGDFALCRALGGSVKSLTCEAALEAFFIVLPATFLSLLLARLAIASHLGLATSAIPRLANVRLNASLGLLLILLLWFTTLLFGLLSSWWGARGSATDVLRTGGMRLTKTGRGVRRWLIALQAALAMMLFVSSVLVVQSFIHLNDVKLGFSPSHVWTGQVSLPYRAYAHYDDAARFYLRAESELTSTPGVTVGLTSLLPLTSVPADLIKPVHLVGPDGQAGSTGVAALLVASTAGYFRASGISLVE